MPKTKQFTCDPCQGCHLLTLGQLQCVSSVSWKALLSAKPLPALLHPVLCLTCVSGGAAFSQGSQSAKEQENRGLPLHSHNKHSSQKTGKIMSLYMRNGLRRNCFHSFNLVSPYPMYLSLISALWQWHQHSGLEETQLKMGSFSLLLALLTISRAENCNTLNSINELRDLMVVSSLMNKKHIRGLNHFFCNVTLSYFFISLFHVFPLPDFNPLRSTKEEREMEKKKIVQFYEGRGLYIIKKTQKNSWSARGVSPLDLRQMCLLC